MEMMYNSEGIPIVVCPHLPPKTNIIMRAEDLPVCRLCQQDLIDEAEALLQ